MPSIFLNWPADNACIYERFLQPARFCAPDWQRVGCSIDVGEGVPDNYPWVGFEGLPNGGGVGVLMSVKKRGVKLLWSVDDDWETIPEWNPAKQTELGLAWHQVMTDAADLILVSTPYLAGKFSHVAHKVVCAPNLTDLSRFPAGPRHMTDEDGNPTAGFSVDLPVRVVWSGSPTHRGDIDFLADVVARLLRRFTAKEVVFAFCGMTPPKTLLRDYLHRGVLYQPPIPFSDYRKAINGIKPDVWLAPLADIEFNRSKSNLRVMEGWALNAAVCASAVGEYGCVRSGEDGRLCDDEGSWVSALSRLIGDHQHRLELAWRGRRRVESEFSWSKRECRRPWDAVWSRVFGVDPPE